MFLNEKYKYRLAFTYYENNYYHKSINILKKCKNMDSYYLLASNYERLNEYEKAIEIYTKILKNDPNERPDILYNRGELYDKIGKYNETINDFKDCIKCQKPDPKAYIALGVIKNEQGEYEEAKEYFLKGRELSKSYDEYIPDKYK
jgi:tetratricopeptide (TPR) repeat protein